MGEEPEVGRKRFKTGWGGGEGVGMAVKERMLFIS